MRRSLSSDFTGTQRFEVVRCLGAGGMGTVYEALDRERNVRVAVKTLRAMNADALLRFKNEFREFQNLAHPNLVSVGELFGDGDDWFFTMELIHGVDFLEWVRPGTFAGRASSFAISPSAETNIVYQSPRIIQERPSNGQLDETRLRTALAQLAFGVCALHDAQKVHRDLKPSNVLVAPEGRVVILDFGLATDFQQRDHRSEVDIVGTVEYMAPEQAAARQVGPPADWYAVGVMLFEALTGQVPITGRALDVLIEKQKVDGPSPKTFNPAVPDDLDALCRDLLRFNPAARPDGKTVLERLGVARRPPTASLSSFSTSLRFIGRDHELRRLEERFRATQRRAQTVLVHGESGLGKSALVRHFTDQLKAREPGVVVLAGSCYERESVPYKAVDGVIDALSQYMRRLPKAEAAALLPRKAALMAQVFPVLRRVEAVAEAPRPEHDGLDPQKLRSQLFSALRELMQRLRDRHPVVVVIDDLQWADVDSLALLGELLRPPEAPSILLVATVRSDTGEVGAFTDLINTAQLGESVDHIHLDRMSPEEARLLAEALVRRAQDQATLDAAAIADEAGGHPLFIDELIRHACAVGPTARGSIQLEEALWARITQLEPAARHVLELVALASGRLLQSTTAQAAALPFGELAKHIAVLRVAHLLRTTGMRGTDSVEPYHDRVRRAVLSHLDPATLRAQHRRLAVALETSGQADPEALSVHWRESGEADKAAHFAILAGDKAGQMLAFDRASRFYRSALDILRPSYPQLKVVQRKLAEALANAGRGAESGEAFLAAADGVERSESVELTRRAADQFLRSGHLDRGVTLLGEVLGAVGLKIAETPNRALTSLLIKRAQLRLRGLRFEQRRASQLPSEVLTRIDTCASAATGLSNVDTVRGADFQTLSLLLALRAGEPARIARAMALEAGFVSTGGQAAAPRARRLIEQARVLAQEHGSVNEQALVRLVSGVTNFQAGQWALARAAFEEAEALIRNRCKGMTWELVMCTLFQLNSLFYLGDLGTLVDRAAALLYEATIRGDRFATTNYRLSNPNAVALVLDDVARARRDADAALAEWAPRGWSAQHYYHLSAMVQTDLYEGDGQKARSRIEEAWPSLERSLFLRVELIRVEALFLRARAAIAGGALSDANRLAGRLARETSPAALGMAPLIRGLVAAGMGDRTSAQAALKDAAVRLEAADMKAHATAARARLAELAPQTAESASALPGVVKNPARFISLLAPVAPA